MSFLSILTQLPFRAFRKVRFEFRVLTGWGMHDKSPHRLPLEETIIPFFAGRAECQRILFVGCSLATLWYNKAFREKLYWTIDAAPQKARFGSGRHIVDRLKNLAKHFEGGYFDVIFMNGVIGWGLNDPKEADVSIHACYHCLKPEGKLVIGWNDIPERRPFLIDDLPALKQFKRWSFPPFQTWRFLIQDPTPYYFDFYGKPALDGELSER
jgi:SAM-dependent methyltransferase